MKQKLSVRVTIVLVAAIYLIGLALGSAAICLVPIQGYKDGLIRGAESLINGYLDGTPAESSDWQRSMVLIYSADGTLLYRIDSLLQPIDFDFEDQTIKRLDAAMSPGGFYTAIVIPHRHEPKVQSVSFDIREYIGMYVLLGLPIEENGVVNGALFVVWELIDLPATLFNYVIAFTIFFGVCCACLSILMRKSRVMEQQQQNYIDNVTHELKSPIASIKALTLALNDHDMDQPTQSQYFGMILSEASHQERMINNMLELSRLQGSTTDFKLSRVPANSIFSPFDDKFAPLCADMGIQFHVSEAVFALPSLFTNAARIEQLLEILMRNAMKFVQKNGEIKIDAKIASDHIIICVQDNGVGIEKDALPHIFERFYKGNAPCNSSGSGLGLAIAREIVMGLKGKIWVESDSGAGSKFYFTIQTRPGNLRGV